MSFEDALMGTDPLVLAERGNSIIQDLMNMLDHDDSEVAEKAAVVLAYMGDPGSSRLEEAAHAGRPRVQRAAFWGLSLGGDAAFPTLERLLHSEDSVVRDSAALALAGFMRGHLDVNTIRLRVERSNHEASRILREGLVSPDLEVSESAALGLGYLGGADLRYTTDRLPFKAFTLDDIDTSGYEKELSLLRYSLDSLNSAVPIHRIEAAQSLRQVNNPLLVPFVSRTLQDESDRVARAQKTAALWRAAHAVQPYSRAGSSVENDATMKPLPHTMSGRSRIPTAPNEMAQPGTRVTGSELRSATTQLQSHEGEDVSQSPPLSSTPRDDNRVLKGRWDKWIVGGVAVFFLAWILFLLFA